jgi:multisubunit Na+/H+ antiporter MnhG subunit
LEGKTQQPEFKIDLSAPASRAVDNLGAYAQKRATSLPPCTVEQMRTINFQEDLLSIPCLPLGVTPAQVGLQFSQQAKQQVDILQNPVIDSKKLQENGDAQDFSNSNAPGVYQNLHNSKWLTLAVATIMVALLIFARRNRWAGFKVVGIVLLVVGGMLTLTVLAFTLGKGQAHADTKLNEVIINTLLNLASQFFGIVRWFTIGYIVAGVASLVAVRRFRPRHTPIEVPNNTVQTDKPVIITE